MRKIQQTNQQLIRSGNQMKILMSLVSQGPASKAELSRRLALSKPSIADNVNPLITQGVLIESEESDTDPSRGRKPVLLRFNTKYRYVFVIDLSLRTPTLTLGNIGGMIISVSSLPLRAEHSFDERFRVLSGAIREQLSTNGISREQLYAIGISTPGMFFGESHPTFTNLQFSSWYEGDLFPRIQEEFSVPIIYMNDADAAVMGEWYYSWNSGISNLLYVSCGMGLGCGLILENKLYQNSGKTGSEIFCVVDRDKYERKTNLENEVNYFSLLRRVKEGIKNGACTCLASMPEPDLNDIILAFQQKDPFICSLVTYIAEEIAFTIANIVNLLCVDAVVLGGEYLAFDPLYSETIRRVLKNVCHYPVCIHDSSLGKSAGIYGLFIMARDRFFQECSSI